MAGLIIIAINLEQSQAFMDDGALIPITDLFDDAGEETDSLEDAVAFVAGPCPNGKWYAGRLEEFGEPPH